MGEVKRINRNQVSEFNKPINTEFSIPNYFINDKQVYGIILDTMGGTQSIHSFPDLQSIVFIKGETAASDTDVLSVKNIFIDGSDTLFTIQLGSYNDYTINTFNLIRVSDSETISITDTKDLGENNVTLTGTVSTDSYQFVIDLDKDGINRFNGTYSLDNITIPDATQRIVATSSVDAIYPFFNPSAYILKVNGRFTVPVDSRIEFQYTKA